MIAWYRRNKELITLFLRTFFYIGLLVYAIFSIGAAEDARTAEVSTAFLIGYVMGAWSIFSDLSESWVGYFKNMRSISRRLRDVSRPSDDRGNDAVDHTIL